MPAVASESSRRRHFIDQIFFRERKVLQRQNSEYIGPIYDIFRKRKKKKVLTNSRGNKKKKRRRDEMILKKKVRRPNRKNALLSGDLFFFFSFYSFSIRSPGTFFGFVLSLSIPGPR